MVRISDERSTSRRHRRAHEKRRQILRAAGACFRKRGFQATGMRDIAAEAGLATANLYYYFEGKDQLLFYCQDRALERMLEAVRGASRAVKAGEQAPAAAVRAVITAQIRCMLDELDGAAAHVEVDALPPELRAEVVAKRDRYERAVRKLVRAGQRAGEFAPGDPKLLTRAVLGALNWTARWYRPDGPVSVDKVAAEFADFLLRGLTNQ